MSLFLMTFVSECESYKNPKGIMISQDHILLQISCSTVKLLLTCHTKKNQQKKIQTNQNRQTSECFCHPFKLSNLFYK